MKLMLKRLRNDWPSWLAVSFFALLPFGRLAEIPLSAFALCLPFLARSADHRQRIRRVSIIVVPIFLCFWLPMVASSFDSFMPQKSWGSSLRRCGTWPQCSVWLFCCMLIRPVGA